MSSDTTSSRQPHVIRSLTAVILGSFILRMAAAAMGQNIQFYFNAIHQAALDPNNPLRLLFGQHHVYQISYSLGGVITASFFVAELIGALFFGAWSDRYGRKLFIIFGPLFGAIAVQITALTTAVWLLVVTRLLEGLSTGSNAPSTLGFIAEESSSSPKLRTRVVGLYEIATIGGMATGAVLGGWLWSHFGKPAIVAGIPLTSPAFALNALVYLASLAILWFGLQEMKDRRNNNIKYDNARDVVKQYWKILSNPKVAGFAPAWIAINGVLGIWLNLMARIFTDKGNFTNQTLAGGFTSQQTANIFALYVCFFVFGILLWSLLGTKLKKINAMLIGVGGLLIVCLVLFAINHQPSLNAPLILPLVILLVINLMVLSGFTPSALAHLADITEYYTGNRGAIMGLYSIFLGIGQFLGSSFGGPFVDWLGVDGMILATAILGVIAGLLLLRMWKIDRHTEQMNLNHPEIQA
jgi:MFS family permease